VIPANNFETVTIVLPEVCEYLLNRSFRLKNASRCISTDILRMIPTVHNSRSIACSAVSGYAAVLNLSPDRCRVSSIVT
jgi:hypothetical protein